MKLGQRNEPREIPAEYFWNYFVNQMPLKAAQFPDLRISTAEVLVSNERMTVNYKLRRNWKEAVVVKF
jgi:hypothetical protein